MITSIKKSAEFFEEKPSAPAEETTATPTPQDQVLQTLKIKIFVMDRWIKSSVTSALHRFNRFPPLAKKRVSSLEEAVTILHILPERALAACGFILSIYLLSQERDQKAGTGPSEKTLRLLASHVLSQQTHAYIAKACLELEQSITSK